MASLVVLILLGWTMLTAVGSIDLSAADWVTKVLVPLLTMVGGGALGVFGARKRKTERSTEDLLQQVLDMNKELVEQLAAAQHGRYSAQQETQDTREQFWQLQRVTTATTAQTIQNVQTALAATPPTPPSKADEVPPVQNA